MLLGDHGGYQKSLERVAAKLDREWAGRPGCKVIALVDYYRVTQTEFVAALKARGHDSDEIGVHAGLADTSLMLAIDPTLVRPAARWRKPPGPVPGWGCMATRDGPAAELGQIGVDLQIERSVQAIRAATLAP